MAAAAPTAPTAPRLTATAATTAVFLPDHLRAGAVVASGDGMPDEGLPGGVADGSAAAYGGVGEFDGAEGADAFDGLGAFDGLDGEPKSASSPTRGVGSLMGPIVAPFPVEVLWFANRVPVSARGRAHSHFTGTAQRGSPKSLAGPG